jgi:hypothetical protein
MSFCGLQMALARPLSGRFARSALKGFLCRLLVACIFVARAGFAFGQEPALSPDRAISAYVAACNSITSFDAYFTTEVELLLEFDRKADEFKESESRKKIGTYRQRYSRGMCRVDTLALGSARMPEGASTWLWDGAKGQELDVAGRRGSVDFTGPMSGITLLTQTYRDAVLGLTFEKLIKDRLPSSLSTMKQDGVLVVSVAAEPGRRVPLGTMPLKLYLVPDKGFMPCTIEKFAVKDGVTYLHERITSELRQIQRGLWIPVKATKSTFVVRPSSRFHGQEVGRDELTVDLRASQFNIPVSEDVFHLEFPVGTTVRDEINRNEYTVGAANQQETLQALASQGRMTMEGLERLGTRGVTYQRTLIRPPWWKRPLTWVNIALAVAVVSVLVWRLRVHRSRSTGSV